MKNSPQTEFNSFFWGGFECADHINRSGNRVNLLKETEHISRCEEDYVLLQSIGIKVVREGICWSEVETTPYRFNFSSLRSRIAAAAKLHIQIVWDLCHFGYPDDLIPTHPKFTERFNALCRAFGLFYKSISNAPLWVVPINEISFLSWHSGDVRGTVPFAINSGFDIKYHLCKAAIEGISILKQTIPETCIFIVEPLIRIHPGTEATEEDVLQVNSNQFQVMDIIMGNACPELGGSTNLCDYMGLNYYYDNQWIHEGEKLQWPTSENIRIPLSKLLKEAYERYQKPIVLTETGHFGKHRTQWLEEVTQQCEQALSLQVDLRGVCIYPVIDRPDWDNLNFYSKCGVWDLDKNKNRIPYEPVINFLKKKGPKAELAKN